MFEKLFEEIRSKLEGVQDTLKPNYKAEVDYFINHLKEVAAVLPADADFTKGVIFACLELESFSKAKYGT